MVMAESKHSLRRTFFSFCLAIERVFGHSNGVLWRDDHGHGHIQAACVEKAGTMLKVA
jgi:hypothetical protein